MINCPKCKDVELIWSGDDGLDETPEYQVASVYQCPICETYLTINWRSDD